MRTLTQEQKEQLANHIAKKPIQYIELYNELYDHYASAYEKGEGSFAKTIEELDSHFDYGKIKRIDNNLLKKTKKSVNEIYWKEFKDFWRWPQIVSTLGMLIFGIFLIRFFEMKIIMWFIIMPILVFNAGIVVYGLILRQKNKKGSKKFESAHLRTAQHYLTFPATLLNLSLFLPVLAFDAEKSHYDFIIQYPIIVFGLLLICTTSAYIGLKVFRTKIRVQYL